MRKRVLLTGASGFLGRACLPSLLERGFAVHAVASRPENFLSTSEVEWHACNLLDGEQTKKLTAELRPDFLLHTAWCPAVPGEFWNDPSNPVWVRTSLQLLEAFAQAGGARATMVGTCAEYDWSDGLCCEESTPLSGQATYGDCKLALYLASRAMAKSLDVSLAWGRIFFLYGPHEHPRRLVASITRALLQNQTAPCSSGEQQRDFLHIDDAASALVATLDSGVEGAVNIASGQAVAIKTIALQLAELIGKPNLLALGALPSSATEPPLLIGDAARLREEVLWSPRYDLHSGLQATVEWWKDNL